MGILEARGDLSVTLRPITIWYQTKNGVITPLLDVVNIQYGIYYVYGPMRDLSKTLDLALLRITVVNTVCATGPFSLRCLIHVT